MTKTRDVRGTRGWIFYDAACGACVRGRRRAGRLFESRGFEWVPLQTPGVAARLGVTERALEFRMHLLTAEGQVFHNADALGVLCRSVWWLSPFGFLLLVPGFREIARATYNWFARHRYSFGGACSASSGENKNSGQPTAQLLVLVLPPNIYGRVAFSGGAG